jgi:hypothetical protein
MHLSHSNDKDVRHFNTTYAFLTNTDHADYELVLLQMALKIITIFDVSILHCHLLENAVTVTESMRAQLAHPTPAIYRE